MLDQLTGEQVYSMRGACVVIHKAFDKAYVYNRESVLLAIQNIRTGRDAYATESAYRASLALFEGALAYMDDHAKTVQV